MPTLPMTFNPLHRKKINTHDIHYQTIAVTVTDNIATITLNRPDKKNAMSFAMMRELIDCAGWIKKDKTIRAVIITGAGDTFCAGIDLADLNEPKGRASIVWELVKPAQSLFQKVCLIWRDMPVPVIACMHGHCIGAGLQLALACDIRIATPDCQLAIMEAKWGLVPDMGLTQSALHVVNADILKELAMTARTIDGEEAKNLGLVTHICDNPVAYAIELSSELANRSPDAVLASKRVVNAMTQQKSGVIYQEKLWQLALIVGKNRKIALKKAKDASVTFAKRQFW